MSLSYLCISLLCVAVIALMYRVSELKGKLAGLGEVLCNQGRRYEDQLRALEKERLRAFEAGRQSVLNPPPSQG